MHEQYDEIESETYFDADRSLLNMLVVNYNRLLHVAISIYTVQVHAVQLYTFLHITKLYSM